MNAPKPPALAYAEDQLGVHNVFDEAQGVQMDLDEALSALDKAQDERRDLDHKIDDREMDILILERGKHADHSEAALSRHLKEVYFKDETLKRLKMERNAKAGECTGLELDISYLKARVTILSARMTELGGYFNYLAVTKLATIQAERTTTPTKPGEQQ